MSDGKVDDIPISVILSSFGKLLERWERERLARMEEMRPRWPRSQKGLK